MTSLGRNIRKIRELKNYSQMYMAEKLGITQGAYSGLENGKTKVSYERLNQIAGILQVEVNTILYFSEKELLQRTLNNAEINTLKQLFEKLLVQKDREITFLKESLSQIQPKGQD